MDTLTYQPNAGVQSAFPPATHGLKGWSFDTMHISSTTSAMTAGVGRVVRLRMHVDAPITSLFYYQGTAGVTLTNCYMGVYSTAGVKLGETDDLSTAWQAAAGTRNTSLITPTSTLLAGTEFYVFWLCGSAGTLPAFCVGPGPTSNLVNFSLNIPNGTNRAATYGSGQTALPASLTLGTLVGTTSVLFCGVA